MQVVQIENRHVGARGRLWHVEGVQRAARGMALWHLTGQLDDRECALVAARPAEPVSCGAGDNAGGAGALHRINANDARLAIRDVQRRERTAFALAAADRLRGHIHDWQLAAALAFARGHARVLLADAVGMGKTVSAALAITECLGEGPDRRVLVLVPAHLGAQWQRELRTRIGLTPAVMHAAGLRRMEHALPAGMSAWSMPGCALSSLDFIKQPHIAHALAPLVWDLLVIDEAHLVCGDSDRHAACAMLARRARRVLLLTATPSDGGTDRFAALSSLGDGREPLITLRHVTTAARPMRRRRLPIAPHSSLVALHAALQRYTRQLTAQITHDGSALSLLAVLLTRRALSSPHALQLSLARRLALLEACAPAAAQPSALETQMALFETDFDPEGDDGVLGTRSDLHAADERATLRRLIDAAADAAHHDRRLRALVRLISRAPEPVVVFSCFRDTALWLAHALATVADTRVVHGMLPAAAIDAALDAFTRGPAQVLVATDVAAQGLNLHARCRRVIHYDLPWRPSTLRQRDGRVDRLGQRRMPHSTVLLDDVPAANEAITRLEGFASRMAAAEFQSAARWRVLAAREAARLRVRRGEPLPAATSASMPPGCPGLPGLPRGLTHVFELALVDARGGIVERTGAAVTAERDAAVAWATGHARRRAVALTRQLRARARRRMARERAVASAARMPFARREQQDGLFDRRAHRERARDDVARHAIDVSERDALAAHPAGGSIASIRLRLVAVLQKPPVT